MSELVSILIPCFDAKLRIGEAIESVLGQTYPATEIIVVDDIRSA
jgi:glycosyltransferase involved in cell wall biosynthesis